MVLPLKRDDEIYIFTNRTGHSSITMETTESCMYFISNICFLKIHVKLFQVTMTLTFQVRWTIIWQTGSIYDSLIMMVDSHEPCPLSGGLRGLLLKRNTKLSWNQTHCLLKLGKILYIISNYKLCKNVLGKY